MGHGCMNEKIMMFMLRDSLEENKEIKSDYKVKSINFSSKMVEYSKFATVPIHVRVDE